MFLPYIACNEWPQIVAMLADKIISSTSNDISQKNKTKTTTTTKKKTTTLKHLFILYFGCDFSDCCPHLYCDELKHNFSATVSSGLPQVFLVYLSGEMIQPGKSFLKFDF